MPSRPSTPTVKRRFAVSSNRCAFPGCTLPLVNLDTPQQHLRRIETMPLSVRLLSAIPRPTLALRVDVTDLARHRPRLHVHQRPRASRERAAVPRDGKQLLDCSCARTAGHSRLRQLQT
jgi:hypothetical protein